MNILVVGNGGREHAIAWKCAQSSQVDTVYVAPGNAGTASEEKVFNIDIAVTDIESLLQFALVKKIDLTIVGPEVPLVLGIVDTFQKNNLPCFGPTAKAAQLEGSKAFTKQFLSKYNIPTAAFGEFTDLSQAIEFIHQQQMPVVLKADGLAAGKGVVIADTTEQAIDTAKDMLSGNAFGDAGARIIIEEFLSGEEASFIVITDGETVLPLATSQDHKARDNGDTGPNTGGMGAYSPAPVVTEALHEQVMQTIIQPTLDGLAKEGIEYQGFLYAGLMIDDNGQAKVLEYNCRLGDPETQPILMRLESDLVEICTNTVNKQLSQQTLKWKPQAALGVVLAAGGYPASYDKGHSITGLNDLSSDNQKVFHAGTQQQDETIVTSGGRVLCVTALGDTIQAAQKHAYQAVEKIHWKDMYYRTDIGHKAILN